ncbi:MAG: SDR family NAD(P)-dependent oxidoreductase [Psychrobacter sp.]|uniref:SDR family NAD(P)-dependent oxidoreductase n=1 Tax=unclassified Psychrobacter TaxID=196806 RepID=UPI00178844D6|nr:MULTISPECIES: SDR family NAD(P)-dependent oxidoreductase [unclassified Psychrobacter]MBE0442758.1 SDR family NAD(P)-dependent oxidoreductase [Psychrobacter sp. FME13]
MKKNILITGSTDGIGKLAAIKLAQLGHNVYLHGRDAHKLAAVIAEVKAVATQSNQQVDVDGFVADFAKLTDVKSMADAVINKFTATGLHLDVLINNAGVFKVANTQTEAGFDVRFVVNYFAPYLLTQALLPLMSTPQASSNASNSDNHLPARIVNLSSAAQQAVSQPALAGQCRLSDQDAYAQSKLALTMWSMALAEQVAAKNINVVAVNPGSLLNTRMANDAYGQHWSSADKGAGILVALAVADEFATETAQYFDNDIRGEHGDARGEFGKPHSDAFNTAATTTLLQHTQKILTA